MPKLTKTLTVFLASPSDVNEERKIVKKVINELNTTALKPFNINLELLSWENSTYPNAGQYPQHVINNQIGDEYDIFIGILWTRFGIPTRKFLSGTLEEFERAYSRKDNNNLKICFYFKNEPVDLYKIDLSQFQKVKDFKEKLSSLGVYYWEFQNSHFEENLRNHLLNIVHNWNALNIENNDLNVELTNDEDEEGFFELFEEMCSLFQKVTRDLNNYNDLTLHNNAMLTHYTEKLDQNPNDFKVRKKIINDTSEHIDDFSKKAKSLFDLIELNFEKALKKFDKFLDIYPEIHNIENAKELETMLRALDSTILAIPIMIQGNSNLLSSVKQLPRMTTNLNKSKKTLIFTLEPFVSYLKELENKFINIQQKGFKLLSPP